MDDLSEMCSHEYPRLVGMLGLYCGDPDVAEDLAQEALVRLCRDWRKVRRMAAPDAWLHRVAINLAHSHFRRKSLERRILGSIRSTGSNQPASVDIEILDLLGGLPHRQRAALILHYYLDLTTAETARVLDIPEGTAKTLIHRASRSLAADPRVIGARS